MCVPFAPSPNTPVFLLFENLSCHNDVCIYFRHKKKTKNEAHLLTELVLVVQVLGSADVVKQGPLLTGSQ